MRRTATHGSQAVEEETVIPKLDEWIVSSPPAFATHGGNVRPVPLCGGGIDSRSNLANVSGREVTAAADGALALRGLLRQNVSGDDRVWLVSDLGCRLATSRAADGPATRRPLRCNAADDSRKFSGLPVDDVANHCRELGGRTPPHRFSMVFGVGDTVPSVTDALIAAIAPAGKQQREAGLLALARELDDRDSTHAGRADVFGPVTAYRGARRRHNLGGLDRQRPGPAPSLSPLRD